MPVVDFTSGWADNAEQTVLAAPARITAIEIQPHAQQVNTVFLQLFNATNPDLAGGDAPDMVIPIPSGARQGRGAAQNIADTTNYGGKQRMKIVFPNGGLRYDTAITIALSTTATAYTAATTTSLPPLVRVFFAIGG